MMENEIARLAYTRSIEAEYKAKVATAEADIKASGLGIYLRQQQDYLKTAQADVADAEIEVRKQALAIYTKTGNKVPHPTVKVKIYTMLDYEPADALDYAREHLPKALKIVKREFEKAAKVLELDFVDFTEEPRATIARDLSEYLSVER